MRDPLAQPLFQLEGLHVRNYRVLRDVHLADLTPLTVLVGPNASGKSTVLDGLSFLAECFDDGMDRAVRRRGGMHELRSRGITAEPFGVRLEVGPGAGQAGERLSYGIEIDEEDGRPIVRRERLSQVGQDGAILDYQRGHAVTVGAGASRGNGAMTSHSLASPDTLALDALGRFADAPEQIIRLRQFIRSWSVATFSEPATRQSAARTPTAVLSPSGDNLPEVVAFIRAHHPDVFERIEDTLRRYVPLLQGIDVHRTADDDLTVLFKDRPFGVPVSGPAASEGTVRLLACLIVLLGPEPPPLIALEEPEIFLSPRLLRELAEQYWMATSRTQLILTTHSPLFLFDLLPEQVRVLRRNGDGYTRAVCAADLPGIAEFMAEGAKIGDLWLEGHFEPVVSPTG